MGGIKLDWHVESEQSQMRATEDPAVRRRRQHARRQLLAILAALIVVLGLIGASIYWRLQRVENQLRQDLIDTVQAEVTALKVGNFGTYYAIQRSANDVFLFEQKHRYDQYQVLKQQGRIELTGTIVSVTIDDPRGRVVLEEVLDGIPHRMVWYYWRYEDNGGQSGWRHVPTDFTFWGDEAEIVTDSGRITYHDLDRDFAQALGAVLPDWWARGCAVLPCEELPQLPHIDIVAERPASIAWMNPESWTLRITSPLVDRMRADQPLSPELARMISEALAERLVRHVTRNVTPPPYHDAEWLFADYARWVARQMRGEDMVADPTGFVETLILAYGPVVPDLLLTTLPALPTMDSLFWPFSGLTMAQLSLDQLDDFYWHDFFQWRLALEPELAAAQNLAAFFALYDLADVNAQLWADGRFRDPEYASAPVPIVTGVQIGQENGVAKASVAVMYVDDSGHVLATDTFTWRLANGTWKRTY